MANYEISAASKVIDTTSGKVGQLLDFLPVYIEREEADDEDCQSSSFSHPPGLSTPACTAAAGKDVSPACQPNGDSVLMPSSRIEEPVDWFSLCICGQTFCVCGAWENKIDEEDDKEEDEDGDEDDEDDEEEEEKDDEEEEDEEEEDEEEEEEKEEYEDDEESLFYDDCF